MPSKISFESRARLRTRRCFGRLSFRRMAACQSIDSCPASVALPKSHLFSREDNSRGEWARGDKVIPELPHRATSSSHFALHAEAFREVVGQFGFFVSPACRRQRSASVSFLERSDVLTF